MIHKKKNYRGEVKVSTGNGQINFLTFRTSKYAIVLFLSGYSSGLEVSVPLLIPNIFPSHLEDAVEVCTFEIIFWLHFLFH